MIKVKFLIKLFVAMLAINSFTVLANENMIRLNDRKQSLFEEISLEQLLRTIDPLTQEQANRIKQAAEDWKRKQNSQLRTPTIQNRAITLNFRPGSTFEEIYLVPNYTTTLLFLDRNGNPWPIEQIVPASAERFQIQQANRHTLIMTPLVEYAYGNLTVILENKTIPVTMTIKTNSSVIDYRVEANINEHGPEADLSVTTVNTGLNNSRNSQVNPYASFPDSDITDLLYGEPHENLRRNQLTVSGGYSDITAYRYENQLYILTKANVEVPRPIDHRERTDGMKLFITQYLPEILIRANGELIRLELD